MKEKLVVCNTETQRVNKGRSNEEQHRSIIAEEQVNLAEIDACMLVTNT